MISTASWNFKAPPDRDQFVWLLTIMGVAVQGQWTGKLGEHFIAYSTEVPA